MNEKELKDKYNVLVENIETARIYDGRNKGVDVYVCKTCGRKIYTRYKDKGVTPFVMNCRNCGYGLAQHIETITEDTAAIMKYEVLNWVRPTFEQLLKLDENYINHVLDGGLMLEDELKTNDGMNQADIKKIQREAQKLLEQLQGEDASFLFIGDEGNCFTIGGDPVKIKAQIVFAMARYPVVEEIIKACALQYDNLNKEYGDGIRALTMDHLIEINSGN